MQRKLRVMSDLSQYLNQDMNADDVAHTNGYASAAGGAGAGGLSMEQRRKRDEIRVVGDYRRSRLGSQGSASKAKTADQQKGRVYDASTGSFVDDAIVGNRQKNDLNSGTQTDTKSVEKRQHFIEPPSRGYDKFAQ